MPRRIKLPHRYTVWIARPGRAPVTLRLSVVVPVLVLLLVGLWAGTTLYLAQMARKSEELSAQVRALSSEIRVLSRELVAKQNENQALARQAARMLDRLDALEKDLGALKKRAGLKETGQKKPPSQVPLGAGRPANTEELFSAVDARLKALKAELSGKVEPALFRTLAREAATPRGYPLWVPTYIASGFGVRKNPFGRGYEFHNGVDLPAWYGTRIHATAPGRVVAVGWSRIFGRYVKIDHGYGYQTLYGHMSRIAVRRGQYVKRGQVVGYVGSTGRSTGPHVHYTVFVNGRAVDPRPFLGLRLASR